ncbi:alkaline-phosphatase-like protein [Lasiosphaeria ovina]|uniref:GPI ethanolamine phosphate transferase 2 n=1 Tax=Lasiosphaeria ovina TaxID=92902 RepID=A0AAE0NF06_9PEZI|nr:alkaline-phosphatase-like protein [Lasiosphaeria ovina]
MTPRRHGTLTSTLLLVAANALIPVAIFVFATGFFPYKPLLPGLAEYGPLPEYGDPPAPPFDRLVFMVVDALRSDFVYAENSGFQYTQELIRNGGAMPFTAHATSPTVTMPRLKAITTGSIPSFLDVVLNLDEGDDSSSLASQDSWLAQMKAKGVGKLVMYGDDTWLKLFPGIFDRSEGTTSFFVSDFTEVDNNVTRHISDELARDDWNTMVLHYLGLDHIGHKGGPRSSHMIGKQAEMDGIVEQIFSTIESLNHLQSTLFVVCGDHGMNDAGNHGGSSSGETSPALVFMSPKLRAHKTGLQSPLPEHESFQYYTAVEQSDLAPTLAALLGFPVPKNNLGTLIPDFLSFWPNVNDQAQLLMRNAYQILDIIHATFGREVFDLNPTSEACTAPETDYEELACEWQQVSLMAKSMEAADQISPEWVYSMSKWLRKAQSIMSGMASNYDVSRLVLGQVIAAVAVLCALTAAGLCIPEKAASFIPLGTITIAYGIMMFASSYVEEEHHFWYWATSAWLGFLALKRTRGKNHRNSRVSRELLALLALVCTRQLRSWNQTGQKFAGEPDTAKYLVTKDPTGLWLLVGATYFWIYRQLSHRLDGLPAPLGIACASALILAALTFKVAFTQEDAPELVTGLPKVFMNFNPAQGLSLISRARTIFLGLVLATTCALCFILSKKRLSVKTPTIETIHYLYVLLAMTQSRLTNIPLFLTLAAQHEFLGSLDLRPIELSTSSLLLQHMAFFAFGGSNAISSIDLSNAYNGVADYDAAAVGALTFVGNWAGPIFWTLATTLLLLRQKKRRGATGTGTGSGEAALPRGRDLFAGHVALLTVFATCSIAAVMAACTVLRTHLFIWTVFSPKYLYCIAWSVGQHLLVNVGVGGLLFGLGSL